MRDRLSALGRAEGVWHHLLALEGEINQRGRELT
jgi:hypothetical protein